MDVQNYIFRFLKIYRSANNEILELLKHNIIGTPGISMLYQHMQVEKKVKFIADAWFVVLEKKRTILGTCCFCARKVSDFGTFSNSYYLRYFTLKNQYRTAGKNQIAKTKNSSFLKREIERVLRGEGFNKGNEEKYYHYAYVDPKNSRSVLLCKEFGFETIRQFSSIIFNRINTSAALVFSEIKPEEIEDFKILLGNFYKDHSMFSFENLFSPRQYYIVRDSQNNIVAGVQAEPDQWRILELPGMAGKLILPAFSNLPILKKLISKNYNFLTLEGLFYQHGNEHYLELLIESLLCKYKLNSAMVCLDIDSEPYRVINAFNLGLVSKLNKPVKANVICRFQNFDKNEIDMFKIHPAYISGTDLT